MLNTEIVRELAARYISHAESGALLDDAVTYFTGAAEAAELCGNAPLADVLRRLIATRIIPQGLPAVRILAEPKEAIPKKRRR